MLIRFYAVCLRMRGFTAASQARLVGDIAQVLASSAAAGPRWGLCTAHVDS